MSLLTNNYYDNYNDINNNSYHTNNNSNNNIMLFNGSFHTGPVTGPRSVVLAEDGCIGPKQNRWPIRMAVLAQSKTGGQYSHPKANTTGQGLVTGPI